MVAHLQDGRAPLPELQTLLIMSPETRGGGVNHIQGGVDLLLREVDLLLREVEGGAGSR